MKFIILQDAASDILVDGLDSANTAGGAMLLAGAHIVVLFIVWRVIKSFAWSAADEENIYRGGDNWDNEPDDKY